MVHVQMSKKEFETLCRSVNFTIPYYDYCEEDSFEGYVSYGDRDETENFPELMIYSETSSAVCFANSNLSFNFANIKDAFAAYENCCKIQRAYKRGDFKC